MFQHLISLSIKPNKSLLCVMALLYRVAAIKALVPGFTLPSILLPNISAALFNPAANLKLPVLTLQSAQLNSVKQLLTNLTSLPTIIATVENTLPSLSLPGLTTPNLKTLAAGLGLVSSAVAMANNVPALANIIPDLPSIPALEVSRCYCDASWPCCQASIRTLQHFDTRLFVCSRAWFSAPASVSHMSAFSIQGP
jgi:hypothetical protein